MKKIKKLAIVGVGLIGGSLARGLRQAGAVDEIVGVGRNPARLDEALGLGVIDRAARLEAAADQADVIVIATPVGAMPAVFEELGGLDLGRTIVTDVGSVKASLVTAARAHLGPHFGRYVPGHPIAGTEKSGAAAALPDLFRARRVILTPTPDTEATALARVRAMWEAVGAQVSEMPVREHDEIFAFTSHLPHLLAYALVGLIGQGLETRVPGETRNLFDFAAGGFRDFTRIASSDPLMWRDICLANRNAILRSLDRFGAELGGLTRAIESGDGDALLAVFGAAKQARDAYLETRQES